MQVTLKKAGEFSRALLAASKTMPATLVSVSAYLDEEITEILMRQERAFENAVVDAEALITASFALRSAIAEANSTTGVNDLLTTVAGIDEKITRLSSISGTTTDYGEVALAYNDISLTARMAKLRHDITQPPTETGRVFGRSPDALTINMMAKGSDLAEKVENRIAELRRDRVKAKDQITALNFSTLVTVPSFVETLLREKKLID